MLKIDNITKVYKNGKGIFNVSFELEKPMVAAVVGPNGSGKSTLFNVVADLMKADSGEVLFDSQKIGKLNPCDVSFMPDAACLLPSFSVRQMLMYFGTMKTNSRDEDVGKLLQYLGVAKFQNQSIASLSQGMKQKVSIVCALVGNPKLIIFDEPLNYLDIESVIEFKNILKTLVSRGVYVLISSHILDFLDNISQKTVFLKNGRVKEICTDMDESSLEERYKAIFMINR